MRLFLLLLAAAQGVDPRIKHVVVLMEENRSFDHIFGYAGDLLSVNGLKGNERNPLSTEHPTNGYVQVSSDSAYVGPCDPNHGLPQTTQKIFGLNATLHHDLSTPRMDGFVEYEAHHKEYCGVMKMFTPDRLPIITSLAANFAVFDEFFCSFPGPTWPNRLFMLSGTSAGCTSTGTWYHDKPGQLYPQDTIFDLVEKQGLSWRNYYNDTPWELFLEKLAKNPHNIQNMDHFYRDAATGNLPNFAWINPRSGVNVTTGEGSNDQHPDHDVALGERYYKDIYEALRAGPAWNETLYIITFDEHGGFYDHVPPPMHIPAPGDGEKSYPDKGFDFKRLGVRIPTIAISPWIEAGTVVSAPPAAMKPAADSAYDLTSILATTKEIFGLPGHLTDRMAWAARFNHILSRKTPRTDAPMHLPPAPERLSRKQAEWEGARPLNELQENHIKQFTYLNGAEDPAIARQGDLGYFYQEQLGHWRDV